jgi:SAM-dependent methyltransferase
LTLRRLENLDFMKSLSEKTLSSSGVFDDKTPTSREGAVCAACGTFRAVSIWPIDLRRRHGLRTHLSLAGIDAETLPLVRCSSCQTVCQRPTLPRRVYLDWYNNRQYDFSRGKSYGCPEHEAVRHAACVLRTMQLLTPNRNIRLLDVGCGSGLFLSVCARAGWTVAGCDPSAHRVSRRPGFLASQITQMPFEDADLGGGRFDVVTFWDVFEHLMDPQAALVKARAVLAENGLIAIEVPNVSSFFSKLLKHRWWYDFEHIYYYSPAGLLSLLYQAGFSPVLVETDNFNLLSCEGLARLGAFGPDAVWGRWDDDQALARARFPLEWIERYRNSSVAATIGRVLRGPNAVLNAVFNGRFLGDQLRVFARKVELPVSDLPWRAAYAAEEELS